MNFGGVVVANGCSKPLGSFLSGLLFFIPLILAQPGVFCKSSWKNAGLRYAGPRNAASKGLLQVKCGWKAFVGYLYLRGRQPLEYFLALLRWPLKGKISRVSWSALQTKPRMITSQTL